MQYLDFSALEHNALFFNKILGESKLCAVVKNDAYGHGIAHTARYLSKTVDCFAVGSVLEAKQIAFVDKDILVLLPQNETDTLLALRHGFILSADSVHTLETIRQAAIRLRLPARVHIKIDSGMSRLGFKTNEIKYLLGQLKSCDSITVEGVYSHFYGENTTDCDKQLSEFLPCAAAIEGALSKQLVKHIANSAGVLLSQRYHLDMARVGLGLYGYGDESLIPVKTVKAKVIAVKNICAGDVAGYDARYVAPRDGRVATLGVGYAQGFSRALVGSRVLINGVRCAVVAVCMGMIIVDVVDVNVNVGDDAVLLGRGVDVSNDDVSIYELLCNLK